MSKKAIVDLIADQFPTKAAAEHAFDSVVAGIIQQVASGEGARLPGLGTLQRKYQPERTGRNPRTGETIRFGGRDVVKFKPGKPAN